MNTVVFWLLITSYCGPCPEALIKDEFGRYINAGRSCAVCHMVSDTLKMSRGFERLDSAKAFYARLKVKEKESKFFGTPTIISNVSIK